MTDTKDNVTKTVPAWLIQAGGSLFALGQLELNMLFDSATTYEVLGAPKHCNKLLQVETSLYPLLDLAVLIGADSVEQGIVGLTVYIDQNNKTVYGGIKLDTVPTQILVNDSMSMELSELGPELQDISKAAFIYENKVISVLDLNKIFNDINAT